MAAAFLFALTGCQSPTEYIAPRVTGRVLDAQTHQPIKDVRVLRIKSDPGSDTGQVLKGGQIMEQGPSDRTAADGTFALASERSLTFLSKMGWYSVTLSFDHVRYQRFMTNYTLGNSTNTAKGEPLVKAGDILMQPLSR